MKEYFAKAAEHIKTYGWCQGKMFDMSIGNKHPACLIGSLYYVVGGGPYVFHSDHTIIIVNGLELKLDEMVSNMLSRPRSSAMEWNDAAGRTKEEVISLLEAAAK